MLIEECLWSWGSRRLIGGVPRTEGVQNGVVSRLTGINTRKKETVEKGGEKKKRRGCGEKEKKRE